MTEQEARAWIEQRWGGAAVEKLHAFGSLVIEENERQNLISPGTISQVWTRHLADSAQLLPLAPAGCKTWLDIGTGAGFPGLALAALAPTVRFTLVEPRKRRVEFLSMAANALELGNVTIEMKKVERLLPRSYDVISARAVASARQLIELTSAHRRASTRYILPRGRSGEEELQDLSTSARGLFHVEQSITDPSSRIIIAEGLA